VLRSLTAHELQADNGRQSQLHCLVHDIIDLVCIYLFHDEIPFTGGKNAHSPVNPRILSLLFQTITVWSRIGTDNATRFPRMITIGERRAQLFCSKPLARFHSARILSVF
jgi:hypothetical protein